MTLVGALVLATAAVALAVLAARTARPPAGPVADRDGYFQDWQRLHGGFDPSAASVWVRGWLTVAHRTSQPLARWGVHPDVVTLVSLWLAVAVLVPAAAGGRWPLLAALVLVASGLSDALDGCVAVLQRRTSRWGYVLDSLVDRLSDVAALVAVVLVGAPAGLAVAAGVGLFLLEYTRARAGNAGGDDVGRVTVGERPVRLIVLVATLLAAGLLPGEAELAATVGTAVLAAVVGVGLAQLVVAVRRQLRSAGLVDEGR